MADSWDIKILKMQENDPTGKVAISRSLSTPGFPQYDQTVGKLSADAGSLCSEVKQTSWPQVSASHLLGLQGPKQTPAKYKL